MNKHYTPDIEEFHVGFEYEIPSQEGWEPVRYADYMQVDCLPECRVKYLDQEDTESLGFELTGRAVGNWYAVKGSFEMGTWTTYELRINHIVEKNYLYIYAMDTVDNVTIFQGTIKNKSELKRILKQIGYTV